MIVLGINTASDVGSIGIIKGDLLLGELALEMQNTYLTHLLPSVDYMLKSMQLNIQDVELFSVVLGPGSWSGLRVGVTTVKTLSYILRKPVVGISTLDVLAYNLRFVDKPVYPMIDAQKGRIYFAGYRFRGNIPERFTEYSIASIDDFLDSIESPAILLGDGSLKYKQNIIDVLGNRVTLASSFVSQVRGAYIAEAGLRKYKESGPDDAFSLAPLYLQKSSAEVKWDQQ